MGRMCVFPTNFGSWALAGSGMNCMYVLFWLSTLERINDVVLHPYATHYPLTTFLPTPSSTFVSFYILPSPSFFNYVHSHPSFPRSPSKRSSHQCQPPNKNINPLLPPEFSVHPLVYNSSLRRGLLCSTRNCQFG